jgi:2-haloacid dehalogenase
MNKKINTIIFDLGGVLVDWKPEYVYRKVFNNNEEKVQWFLNTICTPEWNIEQDAGRTIAEAVKLKVDKFPQYEEWIRIFYKQWEHMFSGPITKNVELFEQLKDSKNYNIYALTNWSAEKWDKAIELFPFFNNFDGVVVSGKEKTRKPFKTIYNILLERYQINPTEAIFIDDNLENTIAALKLNINSIHYKNHKQLIKDLKKFNLNF